MAIGAREPVQVFISHATEEKELAVAWQDVLSFTSQGALKVWLSSDTKPSGGIDIGSLWRENIHERLSQASVVLAIVSTRSMDKPWILWECGVASSQKEKLIIPIVFSMDLGNLQEPLGSYQAYEGDKKEKVSEVCERLATLAGLIPSPDFWGPILDSYIGRIKLHRPPRAAGPEAIHLWKRRVENLIDSSRTSELANLVNSMYVSFSGRTPLDAEVHDILSNTFLNIKEYKLALQEVDFELSFLPDDLNILHRKALILMELNDIDKAYQVLEYIEDEFPEAAELPELSGLKGRIFREKWEKTGNTTDLSISIEAYKSGFEKDRWSYYCGVNAASLMLTNNQIDLAKRLSQDVKEVCLKIMESQQEVSYWLDFTIGELSLINGDNITAIEAYKRGLQRTPAPALWERESAYKGVTRVSEAVTIIKETLESIKEILL